MNAEVMKKACNEAYEKAGHNAFFGNGFRAGVKFVESTGFTKEELDHIEKEMNTTIEYCSQMLVKGDDEKLLYDLKMSQQVIEKVRKM